jgi:hypothetical protein
VVRSGEKLERIGKMAELFDDFSPIQMLATGVYDKRAFSVVGRLQYAWTEGKWSEWHCAFDGDSHAGSFTSSVQSAVPSQALDFEATQPETSPHTQFSTGWLSEDNGQFVFMRQVTVPVAPPQPDRLRIGATTAIDGVSFQVTANRPVHLHSAAGELPKLPPLNLPFQIVELRNERGQVASVEYIPQSDSAEPLVRVYMGHGVKLSELTMRGLRDDAGAEEKGSRQFSCPNCGSPVSIVTQDPKTTACKSCNALIDTSQGIGAAVVSAIQDEPVRPTIELGKTGTLQGVVWQVVGFQHRTGQEPGDDEVFGWDEYLLYNRTDGFSFLVDSSDGWSLVRPTAGAPTHKPGSSQAKYLGKNYLAKYSYQATTTYVVGEFYWKVQRGQTSANTDFAAGESVLSREQTGDEITWSRGEAISASAVAKAFGLTDRENDLVRQDVSPLSGNTGMSAGMLIFVIIVILLILLPIMCSSKCDPQRENCSRSSGYSSGGSSGWGGGGGGHK